jgi:transposase
MHFRNIDRDSRSDLLNFNQKYKLPQLSQKQILNLENTSLISSYQKAQLLQLTTGTRQTTEIWNKQYDLSDLEVFLNDFPFFVSRVSYTKESQTDNKNIKFRTVTILQVSSSEYINNYINNYWQTFSLYDQGVMYGYPTTSISAFALMIERHNFIGTERKKYSTPMEAIGPGIYSKIFFESEKTYYEDIWKKIKLLSKKICAECEEFTKKAHSNV